VIDEIMKNGVEDFNQGFKLSIINIKSKYDIFIDTEIFYQVDFLC